MGGGKGAGGLDGDLLSSMAARLAQVEGINSSLRKEIQEQSTKIRNLESKNGALSAAASEDFT